MENYRAFIVPGYPGWFYAPRPISTEPGAINYLNHVVPGERPLKVLALVERAILWGVERDAEKGESKWRDLKSF